MSLADLQKRQLRRPRRISRVLSPKMKAAVRPYATAVGELVWASNFCLNYFNLLYRELFDSDHINIAVRTWHTGRSDAAQLDLLEAAVSGHRTMSSPLREEIIWAISKAELLAKKRNDAVHSATTVVIRPSKPIKIITSSISTLPARAERLSKVKSLIKSFNLSRNDFIHLAGYVFHLWNHAAFGSPPLPKRPKLRSVPT